MPAEAKGEESDRPLALTMAGWWGKMCVFLAGQGDDPIALRKPQKAKDARLFGRVLQNAEGLPILPSLDFLWTLDDWDSDWRAAMPAELGSPGAVDMPGSSRPGRGMQGPRRAARSIRNRVATRGGLCEINRPRG